MWMVLISLCGFITLVMSLAFCLCWKKKQSNSDLTGIDGLVIKRNPDENVNHLPSAVTTVVDGLNNGHDINKRATLPTNTRRSLPDIPFEHEIANWEPHIDNSSEHYATVEQYQNSIKRHTLPNGIDCRPSISQHSSMSQADFSPYERVKYDKIKSKEHPYAQLQPTSIRVSSHNTDDILEEPGSSQRIDDITTTRNSGECTLEIPAASAVAGGIAASPELPYMTPPVTQANFSGDSQDSSKGYTSISVREPLANILAQTKEVSKKKELDQHYSTVSDDSDDVYTTIPDPNQVYTSESETYARIPPAPIIVEAEINTCALRSDSDEIDNGMYEPAPQPVPPSVDSLKHVTHTHSRQASSSSVANIGSPKPEKRQANSPLPPPPTVPDGDKKLPVPRNIDDLYAKVQKNKLKNSDGEKSPESPKISISTTSKNEDNHALMLRKKFREHNYEILKQPIDLNYEKIKNEEPGYASIKGPESISSSDAGYEVLRENLELDPNYEELERKPSDVGYSKIKEINNDTIFGYSVINKKNKTNNKTISITPSNETNEPNYESMPNETITEFNYTLLKSSGSETDPNYESVKYLDEPPYEKVLDTDTDIPGYEKINKRGYENIDTSESSDSTTNNKATTTKKENPYEKLNNNDDEDKIKSSSLESSSSLKSEEFVGRNNILDEDVIFEV